MKKRFYFSGLAFVCSLMFSAAVHATIPTITTNPGNDTVCSGAHALFVIAANDTPGSLPIIYKWQVSTDGGGTWSGISDTTFYAGTGNDTLNVTSSMMLNGFWYRCIASDTEGADTSDPALLMVDTLNAGVITGLSITGGNGALCVSATDTLQDVVPGGVWSHFNHLVDTLTPGGVVTGLSQGYDTIKYVVTNVCGVAIASVVMRIDTVVTALPITGPSTTCVGHTIHLSNANTWGTWAWSVSNGAASVISDGTLTGLTYGFDTVTYAFTNGCNSVSSTFTVQVDTLLAPGVISGPSSVCQGSWINLSETVGGGVWISGASSVAVVDPSGFVTGVSQGTATISYYRSNGCGASIATYDVTVARMASMITGPGSYDSVGIGSSHALSDSAVGGLWTIADTSIAHIVDSTGTVTGVDTGITTVTYTVTNACGTSSATLTLHVGPAPKVDSIRGLGTVCQGSTITLTDSTTGGTWSNGGADSVATVAAGTGVVTGVATGTLTITYTYTNGFGTTVKTKTIFVNRKPVLSLTGPATLTIGANYFIRATPAGGTFSMSDASKGTIITTFDSVIGGTHYVSYASYIQIRGGVNHIHYVYTNECGTADSVYDAYISPVGVNGIAAENGGLIIYPNPTQGEFTLNLASATNEDAFITITNMVGEKVKELTISTNANFNIQLDQPSGIYFVTATTSMGKYTSKVTVTK